MKALVTGAGGFLGSKIAEMLLEKGHSVKGIARGRYPGIEQAGVEMLQGDLSDTDAVMNAAGGCDVIFHVAARAGVWGAYEEYFNTNVTGTRNVINACKVHGIHKLIYTSTPSVTFNGDDESGVDESIGYAEKYLCHYALTKALAEKEVLAANSDKLATVALRPHLIWGPGDNHLVPRIIERAKKGRLGFVGDGHNKVDSVYIDNAAFAHIQASEKLTPGSPCSGKAYFITNDQPLEIAELINKILSAADIPPIKKTISPAVAYAVGAIVEMLFKILGIAKEPLMTRFVARQLSTDHWFDISAAKRDLGYKPEITIEQGIELLRQFLKDKKD